MADEIDVRTHNRHAWNAAVARGSRWTLPVGPDIIAAARKGQWEIILTPTKAVPRQWFPPLAGAEVLCLAGGGGQQGPILAAAGAEVVVLDNSPAQLEQDRQVADREGLSLLTVDGDMRDLSLFADDSFDLIVHPCSNLFIPDVRPVWSECYRVLRPGGVLMAGFVNPLFFVFDQTLAAEGELVVRHAIPYSDLTSLNSDERQTYLDADEALEFGHTLADQIGGQLETGFLLTAMYEDRWPGNRLDEYIDTYMATRAMVPHSKLSPRPL